ncbi:phospholipid phosphatase 1 [Anabrus simplex]|uniref:phospholipid phosphatase 1 n=1 Tax=Anabrus simplex TaxID=316456 RepID=UPI0035A2EC33
MPTRTLNVTQEERAEPQQPQSETTECKVTWSTKVFRVLLDVLFIGSVVTVTILVENEVIPNHKGAFYCNDPKIAFVTHGDTVTSGMLFFGTLFIPLLVFCVVESCISITCDTDKSVKNRVLSGLGEGLLWYRSYLLGMGLTMSIVELGKAIMGEPRPHFLDTCQPQPGINCTSGYITEYTCTNKDISTWAVSDSTRSFPSGHAALACYNALFVMWFIQIRVPGNLTCSLVPWLHYLCVEWALVCSITRITDFRHHWWDVLGGGFLGVTIAIFTMRLFTSGLFETRKTSQATVHPVKREAVIFGTGDV